MQITDSVIFSDVEIGDEAILNGAIVGEGAKICRKVKLGKGCVVGDQVRVRDGCHLADGNVICPAKEVA